MGNAPSESAMGDRLRCCKCNEVLPPCTSFSDYNKQTIHGRYVYVYNGGEYYRPVGYDNAYECQSCFNQPIRDQEKRREEERREEELNQRLEESQQRAQEQLESKQISDISEEQKSKQHVLTSHLNEFEANFESDHDELLKILSSKCSIPLTNLSLVHLTTDQLGSILAALDELLLDEWISAPPSLSTLQHTQVFITELCALSLEISEGLSLQGICNHMQSLVESISQSASDVSENFLLTQALHLTLMHFFNDHDSCDSDAALIAKQWAEGDLSTNDLFIIEFLSTLISSLCGVVDTASVFILKMEIQSFKLLLFTLTHLNGKESHTEPTEMLLRIVKTNQWTPLEAMTLLKVLSEKYTEDAPITDVFTLVQVYDISPEWADDSGNSLIQALDLMGPEIFRLDFQKILRKQDKSNLDSSLAELKTFRDLEDSVIDMIKNITTGVLQYSEIVPKDEPFLKDSLKLENLTADEIQNCLSQICKAVFDTKGWWPTVKQMLRWCALVLTERTVALGLVGVEDDPCVTAMFAATQVCMGNKLDIVTSSDGQTKEWSDFYKHLGISVKTNLKTANTSRKDVYEADIVYGTMDNFVSDYFQYGLEVMETGNPHLKRGFFIEESSLSAFYDLDLPALKENDALVFAAESLQSLMGKIHSEDIEQKYRFITALFQVLHANLNKHTDADSKIITISQKCGKELSSTEAYIMMTLEKLLKEVAGETGSKKTSSSLLDKLCLDSLFACLVQDSKDQTKELFQMLSGLVAQQLWSPVVALNLLEVLTDHHHDEDCFSIMKILHLMETYQVSSQWMNEEDQSLLDLLCSSETENLISCLERSFTDEKEKSHEHLFDELRQMKNIDDQTLEKSYSIVKAVQNLIESDEIKSHSDINKARSLSQRADTEALQEILAVLCNAVHMLNAKGKWWPRATQMISWSLLALSDTGKLLEMGTGEGKSCVIAMFAALHALRGEKVDVVSSSSVLCQRDAEEWSDFYKYFGITVDTNTNKTEDKDRNKCYQKDVVYGTIEAFAADHLRQIFDMKDVRSDRSYQCIIIDEVDSLLLDQGVQLTYLSSPMVSMQHLNIVLAMIWSHVSQYGFLSTGHQTFVQGPPASFFKAIYDSIDVDEITGPEDILRIAEESKTVPEGFTEDIFRSEKDEFLRKLKTVSQDAMIGFFQEIEQYVPYSFTVYTLDDNGLLHLRNTSEYNNQDIQNLAFLVLEEGLCCPLYHSEEILVQVIATLISGKIQYTPCTNNTEKVSIPGFLKSMIEKKLAVWIQNAFLAIRLKQGREYVVENNSICPVDFKSTGIVELSKKWGDGLQQFIEIKHQTKLSTMSTVTNYISNISFFQKYQGKIYGTTGTLGSETDMLFLQELYPNLSTCKMPTFNRKKLFEVKGTVKTSTQEWKSEIKDVIRAQISPNSYRGGRAALVICETINKANELYEELKSIVPGQIIHYIRSDKDSLSKISETLHPGDVIVATNLAGRGTNIKVSEEVNNNGGLFVILSFLSENTRVELQAFGRTARKGKPGSAQIIMTTDHLQESFRTVSSLDEAKKTRDRLAAERINGMMNDIFEMNLREDLFAEYCVTLQDIYRNTDKDEQRAVVATMNEFWGIWLQTKTEEIEQLKRNELQETLKADLSLAKSQSQHQTSPCSSIYHYINFGNIALGEKQWDISMRLFEKAMNQDETWAAVAFYSHAYCTIKQKKENYIIRARDDLKKAQESLKYLREDCMVCLQFVKMSSADSANSNPTSLEKQLTSKCNMLSHFDKNIIQAIQKLDEINDRGRDAVASKSPMFSLVSNADEDLQLEAYNLYSQGLMYVFAVEEEPRFSWEGLLVFVLGVLQVIGGTLLTVFTCGTLTQVGMGLITEGISDCISGIEAMVTGEFSWASWAIEKGISIGVSLIGFGVGKLIAKGFKVSAQLIKGFGKQLKAMPKFLSNQVKDGLTVVARTNMKNAVKVTTKTVAEKLISSGFGKVEEKILQEILNGIKSEVKKGIVNDVKSNMEKDPLAALVDSIVLSHIENKQDFPKLMQDEERKSKLLAVFEKLSKTALQPFYANLSWQQKLNSSISSVINSARSESSGKVKAMLTAIKFIHMGSLAADAIATVLSLSDKFLLNFKEEMIEFKKEKYVTEKVKHDQLSTSEIETLREFRQDIAEKISTLLADALVEVFHQKFSSHIVSDVQGRFNGFVNHNVRIRLKSDRTKEKLQAGQNNTYIAYMPGDLNSTYDATGKTGKHSLSHAENIRSHETPGTILDIRVLSETTGTKVVILTQDSHGKLTKMQELNPSTKPASQTVTLIYKPKSSQYPDGHYDVLINNQTVTVTSEGKSCLFHALARGMKPKANEEEITLDAGHLRSLEADTLQRHSNQWEPFIKRKEWTTSVRGGDWYMAEGAAEPKKLIKETKMVLKNEVGKVQKYKIWKQHCKKNAGVGKFINADHQPPVSSILEARKMNQNSKLAEALLEVATNSHPLDINLIPKVKKYHGNELLTVNVPTEIHRDFPSTTNKAFRELLAQTISQDDVEGTFKLTILGSMPRFKLNSTKNFKTFQNNQLSKTRLRCFDQSFQQHSTKMVQEWFKHLSPKGIMTQDNLNTITTWINNQGYNNQNDPHRNLL